MNLSRCKLHSPWRALIILRISGLYLCLATHPAAAESDSGTQWLPPSKGLEAVGHQDVTLKDGFWGPRLETHHQTTIPYVLDQLEKHHHFHNFDVAARVVAGTAPTKGGAGSDDDASPLEGNTVDEESTAATSTKEAAPEDRGIIGNHAFDSDAHKALEGACHSLCHHDDPVLRKQVDGILDRIVAAQQDDGYLVSYYIAKEPENRWKNLRLNHEMYNAGHFFEFAVAHHQLTGRTKALEAAMRFADHIDRIFGPGKRYDVGGHQEIELALIKLYRATGERRYLDLCRFLLDERGQVHGTERKPFTKVIPRGDPPREAGESMRDWRRKKWSMRNGRMQDHKPLIEQTEAVGHAVRAGYTYAAMADIARFSDAPEYADAVRTLWEDVVFRKMYLTGGLGTAQYGDEGFGDPYLLPNRTYCESCASIAHVLWQHRMGLMDAHAKYADVMELTLYNSALSGLALAGNRFFYQNPLESRNGAERRDWIGLACCPTNLARFTPQIGGLIYATRGNRIHANLYAAGEARVALGDGAVVKLTQETDYPWDGKVRITVDPKAPTDIDLRLRIPGWAMGRPVPGDLYRFAKPEVPPVYLKINGEPADAAPGDDGYVRLERSWKPGDIVELDLPMPVRRVRSHSGIEGNQGKVALMRGPIVHCFEGVDNPETDLFKMSLSKDSKLTATHRPGLLGGVTVIQGQGLDEDERPVELTAIPYFAWANREKCPMNLWIPEVIEADDPR